MALDQHQRPTAMVLRDPYAGHRNYYTGEPDGPLDEWTPWDFALAVATQHIIDGTTENGHLIWELNDPRVKVEAYREIDKARAAIESATSGDNYKPDPGEYWRTELTTPWHEQELEQGFVEGEFEWRTRSDWIKEMLEEESDEIAPVE